MAEGRQRFTSFLRTYRVWLLATGLLLLHLTLAALLFDPKPFVGGDNAGYMILAEALESGRGYRDIHLPGGPLHAQYPPVYPAMLAVLGLLGAGLLSFKLFSTLCIAGSILLAFRLARGRIGEDGALAVLTPLALSPALLDYSHWVLSEAPFLLLTLGALWFSWRWEAEGREGKWLLLVATLAPLAYLTRAAGLPLLLAVLLALAWRRRWKATGAAAGATFGVVGLWWLWGRVAAAESAREYSENFLYLDPYRPELGYIGPGDLMVRVVNNLRLYSVEVLPGTLAGDAPFGPGLGALLVSLVLVVLALAGWLRSARRVGIMEGFTFFYVGLILLWPQVWTDQRFLLPLLPVLMIYALEGIGWCFDFVRKQRPAWVLPVVGLFIALLALPAHVRSIDVNQRCLRFYRQGDRLSCYPAPWRSFFQAAEWVGQNSQPDAIVINRKPRLFYLFSERRGDVYPFSTDATEILSFLDSLAADYVVVDAVSATTLRYLIPVIRTHTERFQLMSRIGEAAEGATYVLRYVPDAGPAGSLPEPRNRP